MQHVLKEIKNIEIKTHRLVEGLLTGAYHSIFKGRGIEFSDTREYMHGDDVRAIDWNVTARFNHPYIKEYIEERDLNLYIIFDNSDSGSFGNQKAKRDFMINISASLMFAALKNNDNVSLVMYSDQINKYIPPRKGRKHVLKCIRELVISKPKGATSTSAPLKFLCNIIKKRSLIILVSDFLDKELETNKMIYRLISVLQKRNQLLALRVFDPREAELPDIGYIELEDPETGEQALFDTSDKKFRNEYKNNYKRFTEMIASRLRSYKISMIHLNNEEDFDSALRRYFKC
ncbi:DUF58 domain-containing protein [Candidatus Woesearchaeota archaeon]|nr:DUF58 domain-containing protein [Candidatus Woesearchaeota archaeon]